MPLILRTVCKNCNHTRGITSGYTLIDEEECHPLPHPGEEEELRSLGYTWDEAASQGKLADKQAHVCTSCGDLNYFYKQVLPDLVPINRLMQIVLGLLALIWVLGCVHLEIGDFIAIAGFIGIIVLVPLARTAFVRRRLRRSDTISDELCCPTCKERNIETFWNYISRPEGSILCPKCKQRAMELDKGSWAIS